MKSIGDRSGVVRIVGIYAAFGILWIYCSDSVLGWLVHDPDAAIRIAIFKGLLFILLTSMLLAVLIKRNDDKYRETEESLKKSREQYRAMSESIPGISWEYDVVRDRWTYVSPQAERILGYSPQEWSDLAWWQGRMHPEDREWVPSFCQQQSAQGRNHSFEYRFMAKDGSIVWLNDNVSVELQEDRPAMLRGIMLDITERKQVEEKFRQSRNMLWHILNSVPQSIFWKNRESVYLGCNKVFAKDAGIENPDQIVGKSDFDLPWSREESEGYRIDDREVMSENRPKYHIVETQRQADGTTVWLDTTKIPLTSSSGAVEGVLGVYEDITRRKCAEMRERSRLSILEHMATGATLEDLLVQIVNFVEQQNPGSVCSLLLTDESGTKLLLGAAPSLPDEYRAAVNGLKVGDGMGGGGTTAYLYKRLVVDDIETHPLWKGFTSVCEGGFHACWSEPIYSTERQLLGTFTSYFRIPRSPSDEDLTLVESAVHLASIAIERVRAEKNYRSLHEQLQQMQKIEAIGQLTGGIAHDFNNLLTPILVYAEMIRNSFPADDPGIKKMDGLISSANKAKELTQKLLSFSRKQILSMVCLDLNDVILSLHDLLRRTIREDIHIDLQLSAAAASIRADKGQLEQLLINLAVNAQDAIEGNGRITIQTGHVILDDDYARMTPGMKPGAHILLSFSDNGCGMSDEVLNHIFEPFFTTKTDGHGTGLGLATIYGIVKQHDGYVRVRSRVGEGTVFSIYLPEHHGDNKAVSTARSTALRMPVSATGKTILFVDDNSMILESATKLLESAGYMVLSANSPLSALDLAASYGESIDLLVTDVIMPEMKGPELYEHLRETSPELPVLYISGYTYDVRLHNSAQENVSFLSKPFTAEQFLLSVQRALAGNG